MNEEEVTMARLEVKPLGSKKPKPLFFKPQTKILKRYKMEKLAERYKKIFLSGYEILSKKGGLKSFWDYLEEKPMNPYSDYFNPASTMAFAQKMLFKAIWKKYQNTETGKYSVFLNIEKMKLTKKMIDSVSLLSINIFFFSSEI